MCVWGGGVKVPGYDVLPAPTPALKPVNAAPETGNGAPTSWQRPAQHAHDSVSVSGCGGSRPVGAVDADEGAVRELDCVAVPCLAAAPRQAAGAQRVVLCLQPAPPPPPLLGTS